MTFKNGSREQEKNSILPTALTASEMTCIEQLHNKYLREHISEYLMKTKEQLVKELLDELIAKNQAYKFILENGLLNDFKAFCKSITAEKEGI